MNMQQFVQPRSSSNGYVRRKVERETTKLDNKLQTAKTNSGRTYFEKSGGLESPSRDRLIYMTTCLIGHQVEVQVTDGSVFAGIFHAINSDDYGTVLKMAYLTKDASQGQKNISDVASKPLAKTFIIPSEDLVQVIAKEVPITRDGLTNELLREKQQELMTDSCISLSRHVELGRELEPWIPDETDPVCPELDNTFDGSWNRGWDQFEANETLFGVKSTFDEELYTTKLERGPRTLELERVATQLAREIEGEDTLDLHVAEERGLPINKNLEVDEETRYSSVYRRVDDSGYDEIEDILLNSQNDETFGGLSDSAYDKPLLDGNFEESSNVTKIPSRSLSMGEGKPSQASMRSDIYHLGPEDKVGPPLYGQLPKHSSIIGAGRDHGNQLVNAGSIGSRDGKERQPVVDRSQVSKAHDSWMISKKKCSEKIALSPNATEFDPSHPSSKGHEKESSSNELQGTAIYPKAQGTASHLGRPGSAASSTSDRGGVTSTSASRGLSSSSSINSLSSEKSTLNPHAKEFKLNPNAKSFIPSHTPLRPSSPVADSTYYYSANVGAATQIHGMPVGIGIGPYAQQPVIFNAQAATFPQPYYHPNGQQQYGQHTMIGQSRPVLYMPSYPAEMPYNGREF